MATSFYSSLTDVMTLIMALDPPPQNVLDVGIGGGKYGLLCREYLTYWERRGRRPVQRIDGIEPHLPAVGELQKNIYDQILVGDARTILPSLKEDAYDLALLMDVIEHFEKADGERVLRELQRVARVVLVSTPSFYYVQTGGGSNPYADHHSFWSPGDFKNAGAALVLKREATIALFACSPYRETISRRFNSLCLTNRFLPPWLRSLAYRLRRRPK